MRHARSYRCDQAVIHRYSLVNNNSVVCSTRYCRHTEIERKRQKQWTRNKYLDMRKRGNKLPVHTDTTHTAPSAYSPASSDFLCFCSEQKSQDKLYSWLIFKPQIRSYLCSYIDASHCQVKSAFCLFLFSIGKHTASAHKGQEVSGPCTCRTLKQKSEKKGEESSALDSTCKKRRVLNRISS